MTHLKILCFFYKFQTRCSLVQNDRWTIAVNLDHNMLASVWPFWKDEKIIKNTLHIHIIIVIVYFTFFSIISCVWFFFREGEGEEAAEGEETPAE